MSVKEQMEKDLRGAMKSSDEVTKRTLRMALSAIKLSEIEKGQPLDEAQVLAILQKEIKSRNESLDEAQKANRPDLANALKEEIVVLERYLPRQLSPEELEQLAQQAIAEVQATSLKEMGQVMKVLMPRLQGRAAGDQVSQVVKKLLGG